MIINPHAIPILDSDTCTKGPVHMGKGNDILKNMTNYCDSKQIVWRIEFCLSKQV